MEVSMHRQLYLAHQSLLKAGTSVYDGAPSIWKMTQVFNIWQQVGLYPKPYEIMLLILFFNLHENLWKQSLTSKQNKRSLSEKITQNGTHKKSLWSSVNRATILKDGYIYLLRLSVFYHSGSEVVFTLFISWLNECYLLSLLMQTTFSTFLDTGKLKVVQNVLFFRLKSLC